MTNENTKVDADLLERRKAHRERLARRLALAPYLRVSADAVLETTVALVGGLMIGAGLGLI
jgi:hypothetical protein